MDETINSESNIGKRLDKIKKAELLSLSYMGKSVSLSASITIGRGKENAVVLNDVMVSRNHAEIKRIKEAYFLKDLASTNGTTVNNKPVPPEKYVKLYKKDVIRIGRTDFIIQ